MRSSDPCAKRLRVFILFPRLFRANRGYLQRLLALMTSPLTTTTISLGAWPGRELTELPMLTPQELNPLDPLPGSSLMRLAASLSF